MSEDFNAKAQIGVDVTGTAQVQALVSAIAALGNVSGAKAAKALGIMERELVKAGTSAGVAAKQIQAAVAAAQKANARSDAFNKSAARPRDESGRFTSQANAMALQNKAFDTYNANVIAASANTKRFLSVAQNAAVVSVRSSKTPTAVPQLRTEIALINQRAKAEADAAAKTAQFNAYRQASNARQAAAEQQAIKQTTAVNLAERATQQRNILANATQENKIFNQRLATQNQVTAAQYKYAATAAKAGLAYGATQTQIDNANQSLITQRYALYDVARSWAVVSGALIVAGGFLAKAAIDYQSAFAQVQRTTLGPTTDANIESIRALKIELVDLTTIIPTSFADIAGIAKLGGQLGIASSGIDDFTEVTAKLTATTDLSSEAAGTALGRFKALLDVPASEFENLASAILKVGINSVATETQIVAIATQISSMGQFAGFTADQVVGLSGALASVGVQPELARGTITRTFTLMSKAISEGGDGLDRFASVAGVSASEFQSAWGTDKFADVFQSFLRGIAANGDDAVSTLNALGISSVRDVPALMKLAGASEVVSKAFLDAETGYADATELAKQYGIIAETVAAKLTMLGNTIRASFEAAGSGSLGPIGSMLNMIQSLADGFLALSRSPIGKVFLGLATAVGAVVTAFALYRGAQALMLATTAAMVTAHAALEGSIVKSGGEVAGLTKLMFVNAVGMNRATAATVAYSHAVATGTGKIVAMGDSLKAATVGANGFGIAAKGALASTGIGIALVAAVSAWTAFANSQAEAKAQAEFLSDTLDQQTGAITANTRAAVASTLNASGALEAANRLGIDSKLVVDAILGEGNAYRELNDALSVFQGTEAMGAADRQQMLADRNKIESIVGVSKNTLDESAESLRREAEAVGYVGDASASTIDELTNTTDAFKDMLDTQYELIGGTVDVQNALYGLGSALYENGTSFDAFSVGGRANLEALQQTMSSMVAASGGDSAVLATMLAGLMQQLASYGVDAVNELAFVSNMISQLTNGAGTGGLTGVEQAALRAGNALNQGFSTGANNAARSARNAGRGANGAAKEIQTLSDYVSDLSGVFSKAFEFRFEVDQSIDSVADAYQGMVDSATDAAAAVDDAAQSILDADAKIKGLNAANTTLEYQLSVAQEYGDVLRASEIIAEMAQNNADLTDEQKSRTKSEKELKKAQEATTKSLDGSTESSREQRSEVLGLLEAYQKQVAALANTGMSQADLAAQTARLRQQFVTQLTQLGYNRAEIDKYAVAFDDLTVAISKVPRNITVGATVDPALRAVEELLAKIRSSSSSVSVGASVGASTYNDGVNAGNLYGAGWVAAVAAKRNLIVQKDLSLPGGVRYSVDGGLHWFLNKGGEVGSGAQYHSRGGVHGMHPGSAKGTDTTAAWLTPGEFVQQKSAVDYYGLPFMNALNNHQVPRYLSGGGGTGGSVRASFNPIQVVELLPTQLQQLAHMLSTEVAVDGRIIAEATNRSNAGAARRGRN